MDYIYNDIGYLYSAIHRKLLVYDPRATDNPLIIDYFNDRTIRKPERTDYIKLVSRSLDEHRISNEQSLPISFLMAWYEMNIAWIDIIHEMVFDKNAFATFIGEYIDIVGNIIACSSPTIKESIVFRYPTTGETIFHVAAKVRLIEYSNTHTRWEYPIGLEKELKYILSCYQELSKYLGNDDKNEIINIIDFQGNVLMDVLLRFVDEILLGQIDPYGNAGEKIK